MKKKIILLFLSSLMAFSLVLVSCGEAEEEEEEEELPPPAEEEELPPPAEEEEVPPPGANWWDYHGEPEYGGTLTWRLRSDITSFDPWRSADWSGFRAMYMEGWFGMNWTTDRQELPLKGGFSDPDSQFGILIEDWELLDNFMTFVIHTRKGVTWQNKPPVNGREFTANDLEYYLHRMIGGLGSGFEKGSNPYTYFKGYDDIKSVEATDKYTLVIKTHFSVAGIWTMLWGPGNAPFAREVVDQYGDCADWRNAVGTGPFLLTDYVSGSSATFERNPTYWGWDQRHPDKPIPYIDGAKFLIIPDDSTANSALRTGKLFMMTGIGWEQADKFAETNPELKQVPILGSGYGVAFRTDKEPFTDINVRKALNMAIDRDTIAQSYYGGRVDGTPVSYYNPNCGPYYTPFEEWPKEVQEGHSYNPTGARQILADAGYPEGFPTNILVSTADDMNLVLIIKDMFLDIGVDMEIKPVEATQFFSYVNIFKKHDQMVWGQYGVSSFAGGPTVLIHSSKWFINPTLTADPVFDEIVDREATYTENDPKKWALCREADMYAMAKYWTIPILPSITYIVYQPWLRGYSEESVGASGYLFARLWIDHELKKSMGH